MTYKLNNINDAVDGKFMVTKNLTNQAEVGTLIHIMNASQASDGSVKINYRITSTGQDYDAVFASIKDFCNWSRPDPFIARNYTSFSKDEVKAYIKAQNKTFAVNCLPLIIIALAVIWVLFVGVIKGTVGLVLAIVLSVVAVLGLIAFYKRSKSSVKMKMYKKLSSNWGVNF